MLTDLLLKNIGTALILTADKVSLQDALQATSAPTSEPAPTKEEPAPKTVNRKVFNKGEPPKNAAEKKTFNTQWKKLTAEQQEDYTGGYINSKGEVLKEKPAPEEPAQDDDFADVAEEKTFTAAEVRKALQKYAKDNNKEAAYTVMSQFGASKIADIQEKDFAAVMAEIA